jgi:hypothetical protein
VGTDWIPCATAEQLASATPAAMTKTAHPRTQAAIHAPKKPKNPAFAAAPAEPFTALALGERRPGKSHAPADDFDHPRFHQSGFAAGCSTG